MAMTTHSWLDLPGHDNLRWCQRCGCVSATSDSSLFFFPVGSDVLRTPDAPECRGRDEYVDVMQRLLLYAEGSDDYAQAAVDARRLMSR